MDITEALAPNSDQLDAVELVAPRTFTIDTGSRLGKREGRTVAEIRFVGFDRVWRPSKGMLDALAACWGTDAKAWVGRSVTLYNDTSVTYGKEKTGGVRISHLSHIDGVKKLSIRASGAGRKKPWTVQPLAVEADTTRATAAIRAFDALGVEQSQLETHLGKPAADWDDADLSTLQALHEDVRTGAFSFGGDN